MFYASESRTIKNVERLKRTEKSIHGEVDMPSHYER